MIDKKTVHFYSGDDRFCGSTKQPRRFTLDPPVYSDIKGPADGCR